PRAVPGAVASCRPRARAPDGDARAARGRGGEAPPTKLEGAVTSKGLFFQNVIALIWDFDRTLSPHYMQRPLFQAYGVDEKQFWEENNQLPQYYERAGVRVHPETCYLGHILSYVQAGTFPDLTNARLRELGGRIEFFPGVPEVFDELSGILEEKAFRDADLHLEHYVVSTGLAEMIRGSKIADRLSGIWASEFIEVPA